MVRRNGISRIVDDAYYYFMMRDWDATLQLLTSKDKDKFEARFSTMFPDLGFPCLIVEFNSASWFHKSIARKLKMAGSSATRNLSDVYSQIHNLRRDADRDFDERHKRIEAHQQVLRTLISVVTTLNDRVQN